MKKLEGEGETLSLDLEALRRYLDQVAKQTTDCVVTVGDACGLVGVVCCVIWAQVDLRRCWRGTLLVLP